MKIFNFVFYIILFLGFFLPTNSNFFIPFPGALISLNEMAFLLLPIVNLFCYSPNGVEFRGFRKKKNIILLIMVVIFTEFLVKNLMYNQSFSDSVKAFRIGIPLFSSLVIIYQGIRVDIKVLWNVILWGIILSVILSIISLFIFLPIYYNLADNGNVLASANGRIINSNSSFGIIGLYLLFMDKDKWFNKGKLVYTASILSVLALILSFNRTYLALLVIELFYLLYKDVGIKKTLKAFAYGFIALGTSVFVYNSNDVIKRQVDRRILDIIFGETTVMQSTIEDNRSTIYNGMITKIADDKWFLGLPLKESIFTTYSYTKKEMVERSVTDTSLATFLLRYGIVPTILGIIILFKFYRGQPRMYKVVFLFFLIASLNVDSLVRQNSIFFIILVASINRHKNDELKSNLYS